jgi:hypothetical protein
MRLPSAGLARSQSAPPCCDSTTCPGAPSFTQATTLNGPAADIARKINEDAENPFLLTLNLDQQRIEMISPDAQEEVIEKWREEGGLKKINRCPDLPGVLAIRTASHPATDAAVTPSSKTEPAEEMGPGIRLIYQLPGPQPGSAKTLSSEDVVAAAAIIKRRIDPDGQAGCRVRPLGGTRIEIVLPGIETSVQVDQEAVTAENLAQVREAAAEQNRMDADLLAEKAVGLGGA